jgi:hypothetical protein
MGSSQHRSLLVDLDFQSDQLEPTHVLQSFLPLAASETLRDAPNRIGQDRQDVKESRSELNPEAVMSHWYRSATIGSTRIARRAGT